MITKIKVYSRAWMDDFARHGEASGFPFKDRRWHLVSIHTNDTVEEDDLSPKFTTEANVARLRMIGLGECLSLRFWDIKEKDVNVLVEAGHSPVLFDKGMAKQVVAFLEARKGEPGDDVLVVHCDMGVCRSGALAEFACEFYGMDRAKMVKENPTIQANTHVLLELRDAAGMSLRTLFTQAREDEAENRKKEFDGLVDKYAGIFI